MFDNDPFIRPESSMSNSSFASQFPGSVAGGVSLNQLMSGAVGGSTNTYGGQGANAAAANYGDMRAGPVSYTHLTLPTKRIV